MSRKNVFDYLEKDPQQLDTMQVQKDTGINEDNVARLLKEKMNKGKVTKIHRKRKIFAVLAAAVAATLVIGTVSAGAAGSFNSVFGERFAGERVNGIYSGGNVSIQTDTQYKAELLGITGDDNNVFNAVSIRRADGSAFIEGNDIDDYYVMSELENWAPVKDEKEPENMPDDMVWMDVDLSPVQQLDNTIKGSGYSTSSFNEFRLTSPDTIKIINNYFRDCYDLKGQKMHLGIENLYLMKDISTVYEFEAADSEEEENRRMETANKKIEEAAKTLGKGQIITHKIDLKDNKIMLKWMITEAERLSINLKGSWDLNYKSNQLLLEPSEKVFEKDGLKYQAVEINAGAITTGIRLKITEGSLSDYENSDGNIWLQDFMSDDSKNSVTLKNGQKLSCYKEFFSNDNVTDENTYVIQLMHLSGNDWVTVNPEEIASIEIEGNRITK